MTSSFLPDNNVWVAINHAIHRHHRSAMGWFDALAPDSILVFSRHTQLGFLRLLSTESVMQADALTQRQCWELYTQWITGGRAEFWNEPAGIDLAFQRITLSDERAPKVWADLYLAAFAETAGLTLVTFDRALAGKTKGAVLLD
jgi:toxin-antitoxin system PIN domain toxin